MKIAIIDDERPARRELSYQILEAFPAAEIKEADSGTTALELLGQNTFDIIFIDINLNDMEGTTLAMAAKRMLPSAFIIFATAYSEYAAKAFEIGVADYILKPFDPERIKTVIEKCNINKEYLPPNPAPDRLPVSSNRKITFVKIPEIVYIETAGRSCIIHTLTDDYTENLLLGEYEKRLMSHGFYRIHKSYLVNLSYIKELFPWEHNSLALRMERFEGQILPVGREKVKNFRNILNL